MPNIIFFILVFLWLITVFSCTVPGGLLHILLVIAGIVLPVNVMRERINGNTCVLGTESRKNGGNSCLRYGIHLPGSYIINADPESRFGAISLSHIVFM